MFLLIKKSAVEQWNRYGHALFALTYRYDIILQLPLKLLIENLAQKDRNSDADINIVSCLAAK